MKIWVLFSIANNYDQPEANLVAWWVDKPKFMLLANAAGVCYDERNGDERIGRLLNGKEVRIYDSNFRLEQIGEGEYHRRTS